MPQARKQLGKYEIIERLGSGRMAEVYKAYQPSLDRYVAIKLLHPFLADDPEFKDRFEREARNVARLKHPNIVQVHDFEYGAQSESSYMVMELLTGGNLQDLIRQAPLAPGAAARLLGQIASALDYAHSEGVIHRDLRPGNVLLDRSGNAILTNFGLARMVDEGSRITQSGSVIGTPPYMSPEQWLGEAVDGRTDVYALGATLYEMLTGRQPFTADTPYQLRDAHLSAPPPSALEIRPDLPHGVAGVIQKAMAKEKAERYNSAGELAAAYRNAATAYMPPTGLTSDDLPGR